MKEFSLKSSRGEEREMRESLEELEKAHLPETHKEKRECYRKCVEDPWDMKSEEVCHEACSF